MIDRLLKRLGSLSLAVLLLIPSGCVFEVGSRRLALWSMAQQPNQYAVAYPYLWDAVPWMALGFLGLVGSLAVITSEKWSWRWLWFPAVTLLYCLLIPFQPSYGWFFHRAQHPMTSQPIAWAQDVTRRDFMRIIGDLTAQAKVRGEFSCPSDDLKDPSRFMSAGQTLLYEVQCVNETLRTAISLPTRPATIVMRISENRQEAWFQVTRLIHDTGEAVTWVSNYGGQDLVIHKSITEATEPT
jgi:hypothetical protein